MSDEAWEKKAKIFLESEEVFITVCRLRLDKVLEDFYFADSPDMMKVINKKISALKLLIGEEDE